MHSPRNSQFDAYARDYLKELDHPFRRLVDAGGGYFIQVKARIIREFHRKYFQADPGVTIVDIGSGIGLFEQALRPHFEHVIGLDLSLEMLKVAYTSCDCGHFCQADALHLPLPDASADIAFSSCVFHHISPTHYEYVMHEILRIVKPSGLVLLFEHNPLSIITQLVVRTTPLDSDARLLSMRAALQLLHSASARILHSGYFLYGPKQIDQILHERVKCLRKLPFGGQYYIVAKKQCESE